jgi:hypothetical protein
MQLAGLVEKGRADKYDSMQPEPGVTVAAGSRWFNEKAPGPIAPAGCEPNRPLTVLGAHAKTDTVGITIETDDRGRFRVHIPSRPRAVVLKGVEAHCRESRGSTQPCGRHNPAQHRREAFREPTGASKLIDIIHAVTVSCGVASQERRELKCHVSGTAIRRRRRVMPVSKC